MTDDQQILETWYRYAASAPGFIGGALRTQREKAFLFNEQQRAMLGILDKQYDQLWLRLQAMPLPRPNRFTADLAQIVAKVESDVELVASINLERLEELIQAGLE